MEKLPMLRRVSMSRDSLDTIKRDNKNKKASTNIKSKNTKHENK